MDKRDGLKWFCKKYQQHQQHQHQQQQEQQQQQQQQQQAAKNVKKSKEEEDNDIGVPTWYCFETYLSRPSKGVKFQLGIDHQK